MVHVYTCTYLPERLASILARAALENLGTAGMLVEKLGDVVDAVVDDDPEPVGFGLVLGYLGLGELLGHGVRVCGYVACGFCLVWWLARWVYVCVCVCVYCVVCVYTFVV